MKDLSSILTSLTGDDLSTAREGLRNMRRDVVNQMLQAEGELAFWDESEVVHDTDALTKQRAENKKVNDQTLANLRAKYERFDVRLNQLPAEEAVDA